MNPMDYRVRRATIDDLQQLIELWQTSQLPALELEKRFTDFQVLQAPDGTIAGAVGFQIAGKQGRLYDEAFFDFSIADATRPLIWERLQTIARNHGLTRVWTRESAPFWKKEIGFAEADSEILKRLPPGFPPSDERWLSFQLREESPVHQTVDQAFNLFIEAEKENTNRVMGQAKSLYWLAMSVAVLVVIFVGVLIGYLMLKSKGALP
jgi:N-acetylglutamate synthase-like GNAT family acetyltransferase